MRLLRRMRVRLHKHKTNFLNKQLKQIMAPTSSIFLFAALAMNSVFGALHHTHAQVTSAPEIIIDGDNTMTDGDGYEMHHKTHVHYMTDKPTMKPTLLKTAEPTLEPTYNPTLKPSLKPSMLPTWAPTNSPTPLPTTTVYPTWAPTNAPTSAPTLKPTFPDITVPDEVELIWSKENGNLGDVIVKSNGGIARFVLGDDLQHTVTSENTNLPGCDAFIGMGEVCQITFNTPNLDGYVFYDALDADMEIKVKIIVV